MKKKLNRIYHPDSELLFLLCFRRDPSTCTLSAFRQSRTVLKDVTSQAAQWGESTCQSRRHRFDYWVRKIPWRRKWQPTPIFLPGKSCGWRSLTGSSPQGLKRVICDLATKWNKSKMQRIQLSISRSRSSFTSAFRVGSILFKRRE